MAKTTKYKVYDVHDQRNTSFKSYKFTPRQINGYTNEDNSFRNSLHYF